MLNKITPFFQRCEQGFSGNPADDSPIQEEPPLLPSTPLRLHPLKRSGTEPVRDISELKKVLKTPSVKTPSISSAATQIIEEEVNEFDVSPDQVFNLILNSQTKSMPTPTMPTYNRTNQNEYTNRFPLTMSQNMPTFVKASTLCSDLLGNYSTQEATNSNIFNPPQVVRQLFDRGNSLASCDSSGKNFSLEIILICRSSM